MIIKIECPNCGKEVIHKITYTGEFIDLDDATVEEVCGHCNSRFGIQTSASVHVEEIEE